MVTPVTLWSFWSAVEYVSPPKFQCSYDRCSLEWLFVQLCSLQGKSIMRNLAFDLKNSHSLDMFKNRLQNWHYPKSACQICSKFYFFFSFFYNAITKFWRRINKLTTYKLLITVTTKKNIECIAHLYHYPKILHYFYEIFQSRSFTLSDLP